MGWGWGSFEREGNICIHIADCAVVQPKLTQWSSNYTPTKRASITYEVFSAKQQNSDSHQASSSARILKKAMGDREAGLTMPTSDL